MSKGRVTSGPGLVKVRRPSAVRRRTVLVLSGSDDYWVELLSGADVVSEGAVTQEAGAPVYRGSTSVLLPDDLHGGKLPRWDVGDVARVAALDPHFRLRVMRLAQREAQTHTNGPLGSMNMDVNIFVDPHGLRADIDVEAAVIVEVRKVKPGA